MEHYVVGITWALSILLSLLVGGFVRPYLSKKAENLATHEDIRKLVEQVRTVTKTQEDIKAQISDDMWSRQRKWELKKEIVMDALDKLAEVRLKAMYLNSIYQSQNSSDSKDSAAYEVLQNRELDKWNEASILFEKALIQTEAVCDAKLAKAFDFAARAVRTILYLILDNRDPATVASAVEKVQSSIQAVVEEARVELGVERSQK